MTEANWYMVQGAKSEVLTPAVASAKPSPTPVGTPVGDASKSPGQKMMGVKYVPLLTVLGAGLI